MSGALDRVVIVGASLGGQNAAVALRENGYQGEIVMISGEGYLPYDRPPLSKKVLTGEWSREKITLKDADFYKDKNIEVRLGFRVVQVNPDAHTVTTEDKEVIEYTHLVLATGGRPRELTAPGRDLDGIHKLNAYDDARGVRSELPDVTKVVVVGAGFIGAEAAAALAAHGKDVTLIEVSQAPMQYALGEEPGRAIASIFEAEGVTLDMGTTVAAYHGDGGRVRSVHTYDGRNIDAELVIEAVGISPNVELAEAAGCRVDNGVLVDAYMRTSVPGIYAVGDIARYPSSYAHGARSDTTDRIRVEHWAVAVGHGITAAKTICGLAEPYDDLPWFWSDQFGITFNYAGHASEWDELIWRGDVAERKFSVFYIKDGKLAAALCAGRPKDFRGVRLLLEKGWELDRAALADADVDLYRLGKAL